jgi:hypothetical protein
MWWVKHKINCNTLNYKRTKTDLGQTEKASIAVLPAVMGNVLSDGQYDLSDKIMSLYKNM